MQKKPKIMVVEDDRVVRTIIEDAFSQQNYDIITVSSGEDALSIIKDEQDIDIVLLDIWLPNLDGFEMLKILKGDKRTEDIKVIMLSVMTLVEYKIRAFSSGASDYIVKPFEPEELIARIDMHMRLKRAEEDLKQAKERYKELFDGANEIILTTDGRGLVRTVNRQVEEITKYSKDELIGKNIVKLAHPEDREKFFEFWRKIRNGERPTYELRIHTKNKDTVYILATGRSIEVDEKVVEIQYNAQDITERKLSEEKLNRLAAALKASIDSIVICDIKGKIVEVNDATLKMYGTEKKEELIGKSAFDLISKKDRKKLYEVMDDVLKNGHSKSREYHVTTKDGSLRPVEISHALLKDGKEKPIGFVGITRDITERKKVEAALRESEEKYSTLVELDDDGIILLQSGKTIFANRGFYEMFGFSESEVLGRYILSSKYLTGVLGAMSKDERMMVLKRLSDMVKNGYAGPLNYRLTFKKKTGENLYVEVHTKPITFREKPAEIVVFQDITDQRQAEEKQHELEARYRLIADNMFDMVWMTDLNLKFTYVSPSVVTLTGYSSEDFIGKTIFESIKEFMDKDSLKAVINQFKTQLNNSAVEKSFKESAGTKKSTVQYEFIRRDGSKIWVESNFSPVKNSYGKTIGFTGITSDISERKRTEEEIKEKNEELQVVEEELRELNLHLEQKVKERTIEVENLLKHKNEFISHLGHDLKTPLTPLTSLLPLLERKVEDPKSRKLVEVCIRNVNYIKKLILSTLELASLNSEDGVLDIGEIHLFDIAVSVILDNQTILEKNDIEVENNIDMELIVLADELKLKEVLDNLIKNCIRFMEGGGTIYLGAELREYGFATVSIIDTGKGLDEEDKAHIFEEFYKSDRSRHDLNSSGLGLAICKRIVEKHGGKIWAESQGKKKGTSIYFTIPLKRKIAHMSVLSG